MSIGPGAELCLRSASIGTACPDGIVARNSSPPTHLTVAVCIAGLHDEKFLPKKNALHSIGLRPPSLQAIRPSRSDQTQTTLECCGVPPLCGLSRRF
jgi:hypothetical protein